MSAGITKLIFLLMWAPCPLFAPPLPSTPPFDAPVPMKPRSLSTPHLPQTPVHRISALDCRHPVHQRTTPLTDACDAPDHQETGAGEPKPKDLLVIQKTSGHSRQAVKCQKLKSSISEVCGKWGHSKILAPPQILEPSTLSVEECQIIITNSLYQDEKRVMHSVTTEDFRYNIISHGGLHYSTNDVRCTGSGAVEINNHVVEDVVTLTQTLLRTRKVKVTVEKTRIEDESTGQMLPLPCASEMSCVVGTDVYVFEEPINPCPYVKVREDTFDVYTTVKGSQAQEWARQDTHHLLFQMREKVPAPSTCEDFFAYLRPTQFSELFLVEKEKISDPTALALVEGYQVDLQLEERAVDTYERHSLQHELMNVTHTLARQLCLLARDSWTNELVSPFNPRALLRVRGEVLQELLCTPVEVQVAEGDSIGDRCFHQGLPVLRGGEHLIMRANTRILLEPSALEQVPCDRLNAPLFLIGTSILTADPKVRSLNVPMSKISLSALHPMELDLQGGEFDESLLYTRNEVKDYLSLIHHKSAHRTLSHAITREFCGKSRSCGSYTPASGYLAFNDLLTTLTPMGWFEEGLEKVKSFGAFCSVVVVGYLILNFLRMIFNFCSFKFGHGYDLRDALRLSLNPADLIARYADQVRRTERHNEQNQGPN